LKGEEETMYYCIRRKKKLENTAGLKAPDDVVEICKRNGFQIVDWNKYPKDRPMLYKKIWIMIVCNYQWLRLFFMTKKGDLVLYQHPSYGYRLACYWCQRLRSKGVKMIALIHDLESLRKGIEGGITYNEKRAAISDEILLKKFDHIICHNAHMNTYLETRGFDPDKLISIEIFDYLVPSEIIKLDETEIVKSKKSIVIAGNLSINKSAYIYDLTGAHNSDLVINLYGINYFGERANSNIHYHGSFPPDELPEKLEGDFGLVWDGNSVKTCAGNTGEYLRYNNPHKTSLYLAANIPVIVWDQAAVADFVVNNKVGITVESLEGIEEKIRMLSDTEYTEMVKNARMIGEKIRSGHYTQEALKKILFEPKRTF